VEGAERPARHQRRLGTAGGFPGLVRGHGDEGVHGRLKRLDPLENGVDHRDG
jgi:ribosomal protein L25 (general stress protein Ctc)